MPFGPLGGGKKTIFDILGGIGGGAGVGDIASKIGIGGGIGGGLFDNSPPMTPGINPHGGGGKPPLGRANQQTMMADATGGKKRGFWDKLRDTAEAVEAWQYQGTPVGQTLRQLKEGRQNAVAQRNAQKAELWVKMQEAEMEHERAANELKWEREKLGVTEAGKDKRQKSINETNIQTGREAQKARGDEKEMELNQEYYGQNILAAAAREKAELMNLKEQAIANEEPERAARIQAQIDAVDRKVEVYVEQFKGFGGGLTNPSGRMSPFQLMGR